MTNQWNEEIINTLTTLWSQGLSSRQIAEKLGDGFTRNSVIGKIHRLRLANKLSENDREQNKKQTSKHTSDIQNHAKMIKNLVEKYKKQKSKNAQLNQAPDTYQYLFSIKPSPKQCQWPIGIPGDAEFHFCTRSKKMGAQYCQKHLMVVYKKEGHYNSKVVHAVFNLSNTKSRT